MKVKNQIALGEVCLPRSTPFPKKGLTLLREVLEKRERGEFPSRVCPRARPIGCKPQPPELVFLLFAVCS